MNQYPGRDSNPDLNLRRVQCYPLHHQDIHKASFSTKVWGAGLEPTAPAFQAPYSTV
jgi:hypothetical protein